MTDILVLDGNEVRNATAEELAQWELDNLERQTQLEAEAQAKTEAENKRAEILERLGLTADEAKLLIG